ncbi:cytochrome c oxidase subunit II [Oscillatoria nigro-viridis PCC 7112]|uniref:Cytochrome c oxidase subunit 2 n=1 Tax=Phormidium nigroviride PCC 7112 TaxID=179408 RepID=K9VCC7_9CYAN|nr:cytochrome c oxidase subunit II [Oscillatoria nigro-viridis]AFZ05823.1 cytochrome c oxidase subunit II [Oscillatoria nigro-viridis PCC 7112]
MRKIFDALLLMVFIAVILVIARWIGDQAYSWMPVQATAEAERVDRIFSFLTSVGTFIFLAIAGTIGYSILIGRAPKGDWSHGHPARSDVRLEILWTAAPTVLVLWLALQSFNIYQQLEIEGLKPVVHLHLLAEPAAAATVKNNTQPVAENIEVVAKQWVWSFRYPNNVISNELHLKVNERTRLNLHSQDVIHGFYVPEFRLKQDIIPNRNIDIVLTPTKIGKFHLRDSQFSGIDFALMVANVYVDSSEAYSQWLSQAATRK